MRLSKEEYREAKGCLKRFNYNCIKIMNIGTDIMSISSAVLDGMPKAPYSVSDTVLDRVIKLQEDEELQQSMREYKAVMQAKELVNKDSKYYDKFLCERDIENVIEILQELLEGEK